MFTIYGREDCSFCTQVIKLLEDNGYQYEYKTVSDHAIRDELHGRAPLARTVPQVFLEDHYIGGYSDLQNAIATGGLAVLVEMVA